MTDAEFKAACQTITVKSRTSFYASILLGLNSLGAL